MAFEKRKDHYLSPRWSTEMADCSLPMTFDQYSMCSFGCRYCFAAYQKECGAVRRDAYLAKQVSVVDVEKVKRTFLEPGTQFWPYVQSRTVMQWGGMADPFCGIERKMGVGLELLRFFREIDYPITFSTKGTWWVKDERYAELFRDNPKWTVKVTVITMDERKCKLVEPATPLSRKLMELIEGVAKLNCGGAILRLRPFMVGISDPGHVQMIEQAGSVGAMSLSTEFFCLEQRNPGLRKKLLHISRAAGFDYYDFYRKNSHGSGYLRLNRAIKKPFVDDMEAACNANGMRFYVSDPHFKERCADTGCCGIGANFKQSKGQFTEALMIAKEGGQVRWPDIAGDGQMDHLKGFLWRRAEGYNTKGTMQRAKLHKHTMFDYMRWLWNNPDAGQSPYRVFDGVLRPNGEKDLDGDLIYEYDRERAA